MMVKQSLSRYRDSSLCTREPFYWRFAGTP